MSKKLIHSEFITRSNNIHASVYNYSQTYYKNSRTKVIILCNKHGEFTQRPHEHLSGQGCPKCGMSRAGSKNTSTTEMFVNKANEIHNNSYDYSRVIYIKSNIKIKINCKCHGEFLQTPNHHLQNHGCPKCKNLYTTKEFVDRCNKIHNNRYDYSKTKYSGIKTKAEIVCRKHGSFFQSPEHHINGKGCPRCNVSKGEQKISQWLDARGIKFVPQKEFQDCRNPKTNRKLKFDFYVPEKNLLIEYDGFQHFNKVFVDITLVQYRDEIKNQYCKDNNIKLIRIPYTKIKNMDDILSKEIQ